MTNAPQDDFLQACGLRGPLELLVKRPGHAEVQLCPFDQPFVLIGRDPRTNLCLKGEQVSRRHVYLQAIGGHAFFLDLDSDTGTRGDAGPLPHGWLLPHKTIRIGPCEVGVPPLGGANGAAAQASAPPWSPVETKVSEPSAGPLLTLEFRSGRPVTTRCRLGRVLTLVGRAKACRVRLTSRAVSDYHCALLRTPTAVWVIDLLGRGGVRVNRARVVWSPLAEGDRLTVGDFEMLVRPSAAADAEAQLPAIRRPSPPVAALPHLPPLTLSQEFDAPALGPVVRELRLMQQGMFDHFHQALMTMTQVLGTVHRDQMGLIREELQRVQALSQELNTLRADLARRPSAAAPPAALAAPAENGARAAAAPAPRPAAAAAPRADDAVHVWLTQRIEALEQERQTRWQKVMGFMLGK
jgi:pSer/pThr/pTyr-binding forkhead associated (FHA) protein